MKRKIRNYYCDKVPLVSLLSSSCSRRSNILVILLLWIGSQNFVLALTTSSRDNTNINNDNHDDNDDNRQHRHVQCPKECLVDRNNKHDKYQKSSSRSLKNNKNKNSTTTTSSSTNENEDDERPMTRIFYLILIHNKRTADDAVHLFRSIRNSRNIILFHIDIKAIEELKPPSELWSQSSPTTTNHNNNNTFQSSSSDNNHDSNNNNNSLLLWDEILYCPCGSIIQIVSKYSIKWGHWNMTEPTLYGIEIATSNQYYGLWDIFINLSGDTIPIYKPNSMALKLYNLYPYNFVTSSSCETNLIPTNIYTFPKYFHKRKHYTNDETEYDPIFTYNVYDDEDKKVIKQRNITITTYFGSQWIMVQSSFCLWLNEQLQIPNSWVNQYRIYLIQSNKLMSDETFIPTILMHSPFHNTIPIVSGNDTRHFIRHQNYYPKRTHNTQNNMDYDNENSINNNNDGLLIYANGTISNIYHVRYERMDEHMPSAYGYFASEQRYDVSESLIDIGVDVPRVWGPYYLGIYDLGNIKNSGALFIRKVSSYIDSNMISILPVNHINDIPDIYWPTHEMKLSSKPNWEQKIQNMIKQRQQKEKEQQQQQQKINNLTSSQQQQVKKMRQKDIEDESTKEQDEKDDNSYPNNNDDEFDPITADSNDSNDHHSITDKAYYDPVQEDGDDTVEL